MNQPKPRRTSSRKRVTPNKTRPSSRRSSEAKLSEQFPKRIAEEAIRKEIPAITQYLAHESSLLDLIAIEIYQHLIRAYGADLDQEMTSDTILTTLKNWAGEQCDRHNLWQQTAEDISSALVSKALQAMQRDLGDRVLEALDWGEFNQILFQYMFEYPTLGLKEQLQPLEESYAQHLAHHIIQDMDLGNQSLSLLKRRLGLASRQDSQPQILVGNSLSDVSPILELASELPLLVQEGETGQLSFSDQFQADLWSSEAREVAYLRYHSKHNRHRYLEHYITSAKDIKALPWELVEQIRLKFGLSAAKLQLLLAAYATQYPRWDQAFTLTAANLIEALGWPSRHPNGAGDPTRDNILKNQATNLLYALSCVLVKLVWVDYQDQDDGETPEQTRGQAIGRSPVGKLWDVLITPQGVFDRQSGEIDAATTILLTIRPGLWVELLDGGYNPPPPSLDMAFADGANQSLNQFGMVALRLLQLGAYSHELTIRLVIYLMLDTTCRSGNVENPIYEVRHLLEQVTPDTLSIATSDIKQGQRLFEEWNTALQILGELHSLHSPQTARTTEDVGPTRLYVTPYPKWLSPHASMRKPRGWVKMWLAQKIQLQFTI